MEYLSQACAEEKAWLFPKHVLGKSCSIGLVCIRAQVVNFIYGISVQFKCRAWVVVAYWPGWGIRLSSMCIAIPEVGKKKNKTKQNKTKQNKRKKVYFEKRCE